ncbi:MAG: hypothetical protein H0V09_11270, partial [Gemmatimonadetes bacterium]|nr:hypothetical protein [Gemmatimonadota bacterium]
MPHVSRTFLRLAIAALVLPVTGACSRDALPTSPSDVSDETDGSRPGPLPTLADAVPASTASPVISGITWDFADTAQTAMGSDMWPVTWHTDDEIHISWGDGGGFGGTNSDGRVPVGFGKVSG